MSSSEMDNRKMYPLSSSQLSIFMAWKYSFHKQVMNIPTSFLTDAPLDLDVLKEAAAEAVRRNDAFGIRITKQGKDRLQYFTDRKVLALEKVDFTGQTFEQMEAFFYQTGATKMKLYDRPLAKIYIVRAPDGKCGVFTCVSHLILDSWAISLFYKDLMSVYFALLEHTPMPKPLRSCEATLQKDIEYLSSERYQNDLAFWTNEVCNQLIPPFFTHVNGSRMLQQYRKLIRKPEHRFGRSVFLRTTARHEVLMVEKDDVDLMKDFCLKNNFPSMYLLFIMGLRSYFAKVNNRSKTVSIYNIVARRGTIEEKMSGGTRVHFLSFTTVLNEDMTFREALDVLMEKQNSIYRHADFSSLRVFEIEYPNLGSKPGEDYRALTITFQPVPMEIGNGMKASTKWYCNGASAQPFYLTIMDGDGTGSLRCYYEYMNKHIKAETVRECHHFAIRVIKTGISNPMITVGELLNLPTGS